MFATIFIALGSNLGDKQKNCEQAVGLLREHPHIRVEKISSWHATKALTLPGETHPDFINGVVQIETDLSPEELAKTIKAIEYEMGRKPSTKKWQPRIIDLDILFYGDKVINIPQLKIPHPFLHERLFVLEPLHEIAPQWVHPVLKKTVAELLENMLKKTK